MIPALVLLSLGRGRAPHASGEANKVNVALTCVMPLGRDGLDAVALKNLTDRRTRPSEIVVEVARHDRI
eukprot:4092815-Alexandrium_andersonii.AAC.1